MHHSRKTAAEAGGKMRKRRQAGFAGALLLWTASCANMQTVQGEAVDTGETQNFNASYADVVWAAREGIAASRLDVTQAQEQDAGFVFLFVRPASGMQWGGVGRLVIDRSDAPPTVVHVTYDPRFGPPNAGQERWSRRIFIKMRAALRQRDPSPKS
jgi:hypothetical protein